MSSEWETTLCQFTPTNSTWYLVLEWGHEHPILISQKHLTGPLTGGQDHQSTHLSVNSSVSHTTPHTHTRIYPVSHPVTHTLKQNIREVGGGWRSQFKGNVAPSETFWDTGSILQLIHFDAASVWQPHFLWLGWQSKVLNSAWFEGVNPSMFQCQRLQRF